MERIEVTVKVGELLISTHTIVHLPFNAVRRKALPLYTTSVKTHARTLLRSAPPGMQHQ